MLKARRANKKGNLKEAKQLRQQAQKLPSQDPYDPQYRRLKYVRYADDFLLSFIGPRKEAEEIKRKLREFLQKRLLLELSEEKTLITHARTEAAKFLGYEVTVIHNDNKRTGQKSLKRRSVNGNIGLRVPRRIIEENSKNYKRKGKAIHRAELLYHSDYDIVTIYQTKYRA